MDYDEPDEAPESETGTGAMLRGYAETIREFRLFEYAARSHYDQMLTWVIGLMGGGVLANVNLSICPSRELMWAAAPWVLGVLIAVAGRISAEFYRDHPGRIPVASVYLIRMKLATRLDRSGPRELLDQLTRFEDWEYQKRADRAQKIARRCYGLALGTLLIGLLSVFGRAVLC